MSSRREDDIRTNLRSIGHTWKNSYEVTGDDNRKDIAFYISCRTRELGNKFRLDNFMREEIFRAVCDRAGGAYKHYHSC